MAARGDSQTGRDGTCTPEHRTRPACAEARRPERERADQQRSQQPGEPAEQSDEDRLSRGETGQVGVRRAAGAQERLLAAAILSSRPRDGDRQERGQQRARQAEEQECDAGIEAVAARLVEAGRQVVADDGGAGQPRLQVLRQALRRCERAGGVAGKRGVRELGVHLVAYERGSNARQAVEEAVPAVCGEEDDVVGRWAGRRRA